ncbi:hypothetical protein ACS0TY_013964 [Phlomoides rotata]
MGILGGRGEFWRYYYNLESRGISEGVPTLRWELWECIQAVTEQYIDSRICIMGDFNAIREVWERVGRAATWDITDMNNFNNFIRSSDLTEIQLVGRSFT